MPVKEKLLSTKYLSIAMHPAEYEIAKGLNKVRGTPMNLLTGAAMRGFEKLDRKAQDKLVEEAQAARRRAGSDAV